MTAVRPFVSLVVVFLVSGCGGGSEPPATTDAALEKGDASPTSTPITPVDRERVLSTSDDGADWLLHGRDWSEQRHSPLDDIDTGNVSGLGLAWYFDVPTDRGMEATPIVVDGRMFVTGAWSIVYALDAASGEELWRYDPQVAREWARYGCCDAVNRGVAVWGDSVFVGTFDGYLVSTFQRTAPLTASSDTR